MTPELAAFLDSVQCTAPFTLDDARAMHAALREVAKAPCEVVLRGDDVEVTIWLSDTIVTRAYRIA